MTNFVLCIHVQIRFASTEKNYSHRLACILLHDSIINALHKSASDVLKFTKPYKGTQKKIIPG